MIWQVDREMVLLLAGGRALLMQLAHPKVAAGVAERGCVEGPTCRGARLRVTRRPADAHSVAQLTAGPACRGW